MAAAKVLVTGRSPQSVGDALPHAEIHRLNSGHFAVEDSLTYIVEKMKAFYGRALSEKRVDAA